MFFFISSGAPLFRVLMVELVDTLDLDSSAREGVRVRLSVGALGICKLFTVLGLVLSSFLRRFHLLGWG